jgi:hypothetical protein
MEPLMNADPSDTGFMKYEKGEILVCFFTGGMEWGWLREDADAFGWPVDVNGFSHFKV